MTYNLTWNALTMAVRLPRYLCQEEALTLYTSCLKSVRNSRQGGVPIRLHIETSYGPGSCCMPPTDSAMTRSRHAWTRQDRSSASGASVSSNDASTVSKRNQGEGAPLAFPPSVVVAVKALACQLQRESGSSHAIPSSKPRPLAYSASTKGVGRGNGYARSIRIAA